MARHVQMRHVARPVGHERRSSSRKGSTQGRISILIGVLLAVCATAVATAGGTFALWSTQATVSASSITSGTIGLRVNDGTNTALNFGSQVLVPGGSVYAAAQVTDTGSVPLDVSIASGTVTTDAKAMAPKLTVFAKQVTDAASCTAANVPETATALLTAPPTGTLAQLTTSGTTQSAYICFKITLATSADNTMQSASTTFSLTLLGTQRTS